MRPVVVVASLALVLAASSVLVTVKLFTDLRDESIQRRNQTCTIFETKQKSDVDALGNTYRYLAKLSPQEMAMPLNRAVVAQLPKTVREAQIDDAPTYCDAPGVGLPEPDPVLPRAPSGFTAP